MRHSVILLAALCLLAMPGCKGPSSTPSQAEKGGLVSPPSNLDDDYATGMAMVDYWREQRTAPEYKTPPLTDEMIGNQTLAAHGVELSNGFASRIPFPLEAKVDQVSEGPARQIVTFSLGLSYDEAVAFFETNLPIPEFELQPPQEYDLEEDSLLEQWIMASGPTMIVITVHDRKGQDGSERGTGAGNIIVGHN